MKLQSAGVRRVLASLLMVASIVTPLAARATVDNGITDVSSDAFRCTVNVGGARPFFEGNACATFVVVEGDPTVYGAPAATESHLNEAGSGQPGPVSRARSGAGTEADPYVITTTSEVRHGLTLTQTDSWVTGGHELRTALAIRNSGEDEVEAIVSHAIRCFEGDRHAFVSRVHGDASCVSQATGGSITLAGDGTRDADAASNIVSTIQTGTDAPHGCECVVIDPALLASKEIHLSHRHGEQHLAWTTTFRGEFPAAPVESNEPPSTATANFSCRASIVRVTTKAPLPAATVEPLVANGQDSPCRTAGASVLTLPIGSNGDHVNVVPASTTDREPFTPTSAATASASAHVLDAQIGGTLLRASVLTSQANESVGPSCDPFAPVARSGEAHVASVTVNGVPIAVGNKDQDITIAPGVILHLRQEIATANSLTERALFLETPLADVIVSESKVNDHSTLPTPTCGGPGEVTFARFL